MKKIVFTLAAALLTALLLSSGSPAAAITESKNDSSAASHIDEEIPKTGDDIAVPVVVIFIMSAVCIHFCLRGSQRPSADPNE